MSGPLLDEHDYASLQALSSSATSSFTIVIMASITAFTFLGSLSRISSVKRLGTICQERPKGSLIQPHCVGFAPAFTSLSQYSSWDGLSLFAPFYHAPATPLKGQPVWEDPGAPVWK